MTADIHHLWNELHKERFKAMALSNQLPASLSWAGLLDQLSDPYSNGDKLLDDLTSCPLDTNLWFPEGHQESFFNQGKISPTSLSTKVKDANITSTENWKRNGPPYMQLRKGYRPSPLPHQWNVLARDLNLNHNNSGIVTTHETKDFGQTFQRFQHQLLTTILASWTGRTGKAGGKSPSLQSFRNQYPTTGESKQAEYICDDDATFSSVKNHAICDDSKITPFSLSFSKNHAICGIKTTSFLGNVNDQKPVVKTESLSELQVLLIHVSITGELLRRHVQAFQKLITCAVTVRILLFVVITIVDQCEKLRKVGDVNKKDSFALKKKEKDLLALSCEEGVLRNFFVVAAMDGQMGFNPNGFGQGGMMEGEDGNGEAPAMNGMGGNAGEIMREIPDFGNFADEDYMYEDEDEALARRYRGEFEVRSGRHGTIRRVPSISALPPVGDFMDEEEDDQGYAQAGFAEWANDALIHHGDLAELLLQIEEEHPIPHDPEPPHGVEMIQDLLWMEDPLLDGEGEMIFLAGVNAANAA